MQSIDHRRSPFFSAAFLRRLQKMIQTRRGPATEVEQAIERALRRLASVFAALGR
jgi:N-acyl-D-aspartate/D-glutamate deacylase